MFLRLMRLSIVPFEFIIAESLVADIMMFEKYLKIGLKSGKVLFLVTL